MPLHRDGDRVTGFVKIFRDATHLRVRTRYLENELKGHNRRSNERETKIVDVFTQAETGRAGAQRRAGQGRRVHHPHSAGQADAGTR